MAAKRQDLQGIRGLAIIAVLLFHFYPQQFPNGFLGVDQFFVLSGFLMCMLLSRADSSPCSLLVVFYSKRFRRILPLYILLIFLSLLALFTLFPDTSVMTNTKSATRALLFVSNFPKLDEDDYFEQIANSIDIFSHTWSLSVEVQYYFLVPVLFLLASRFHHSPTLQYGFYALTGLLSFIFYSISDANVAFNSVFSRIWQFLIGMIVYLITDANGTGKEYLKLENGRLEGEDGQKLLQDVEKEGNMVLQLEKGTFHREYTLSVVKSIILMSMLLITIAPFDLPVIIFRPFVTVSTGILMLVSENDKLLSNRVLTYIGDISYSLYLIHWPICAYVRMGADGEAVAGHFEILTGLSASIILAILIFETFEKWYLHLSSISIGLLSVFLMALCVAAVNKNDIFNWISSSEHDWKNFTRLDGLNDNMTMDDAKLLNRKWDVDDVINLLAPSCDYERPSTPLGRCTHKGLSPDAKYKIMLFGNSWTANHAKIFYQECGHAAHSILQESEGACEPFYPTTYFKNCPGQVAKFLEHLKEAQPDFGFVFTRHMDVGKPVTAKDKLSHTDSIYQLMLKNLQNLLPNIKKKLYILNALPRVRYPEVERIVTRLQNGTDPAEIDRLLVDEIDYKLARERTSRLVKECGSKCELIDYLPTFWNETTQTVRYYDDRGFAFVSRGNHITPRGLEEIRPIWRNICHQLG